MSGVLAASLCIALLAFWVFAPLFRPGAGIVAMPAGPAGDLLEAKEAIYRSIIDLEFDFKMDKVSREDYLVMRRQHEDEAMQILSQIDSSQPEDTLEAEIAEARERLRRK